MRSSSTQHAGDFLVVRVNEPTLSQEFSEFFKIVKPIGVHFGKDAFLFEESYYSWLKAFEELRGQILHLTGREKMIWAIDHEGGRIHRFPPPTTRFSYPLNWRESSRKVGSAMGEELCSLGFNVLFGPCLDIFSNPHNAVIGPRAFGKSPPEVDEFAHLFIQGVEHCDIIPTLKHFPGHGDTETDSHFELPVVQKELPELREHEVLPFEYAINGGAEAVMLAHILFPKIDSEFPSSLSKAFAKDLLRDSLNFSGVSFTDDLDMKAIYGGYSPDQIATQLIQAEINFGIFNHHLDHAHAVFRALQGKLTTMDEQASKILERTHRFVLALANHPVKQLKEEIFLEHENLSASLPEEHEIQVKEFTGD